METGQALCRPSLHQPPTPWETVPLLSPFPCEDFGSGSQSPTRAGTRVSGFKPRSFWLILTSHSGSLHKHGSCLLTARRGRVQIPLPPPACLGERDPEGQEGPLWSQHAASCASLLGHLGLRSCPAGSAYTGWRQPAASPRGLSQAHTAFRRGQGSVIEGCMARAPKPGCEPQAHVPHAPGPWPAKSMGTCQLCSRETGVPGLVPSKDI